MSCAATDGCWRALLQIVQALKPVAVLDMICGTFHCAAITKANDVNVRRARPACGTGLLSVLPAQSTLWVWGGGAYGKLGLGDDESNRNVPTECHFFRNKSRVGTCPAAPSVAGSMSAVAAVVAAACGLHHTVAITK